ncbi:PspC domain-containing protein [Cellulophaga sp. Hel_I_12]|uniref:PspC domain-containing protein n=1 Tax=Cellulophaga sp. Hel_I_12 TaxID=1249972 RepID=UPI000645AB71|nr:PspC domain-containing protein [Cellulophaga sp. Hel_I_12]
MNKTVNINLANILFHIDEDAYNRMKRYLESVKRSFANTPGSDEILADIEARIAELFHEKLANDRQVITSKVVDEVIAIMGQPEDYIVDEDIFEDEPRKNTTEAKRVKKLYRDVDKKYVAGVSAGLAHYVGIEAIWVRILWLALTFFSGGGFILIYGLLWILIPEAKTTAEKLDMRGEDVNISNIERKVKEGFDDVAERVKNVDYEKVGNKVKSSSKTFFDTIGDIIMFFFKIFGKFMGILLILAGGIGLLAMLVALFTAGVFDNVHVGPLNLYELVDATNTPLWLVVVCTFFLGAIPLFFLMYLGLKILITNLKSIGSVAKFTLLGLWLLSLIFFIVLGVQQATSRAFWDTTAITNEYPLANQNDTLNIVLNSNEVYWKRKQMNLGDLMVSFDDEGNEILVSNDVRFSFKTSTDSLMRVEVKKNANGSTFSNARETAEKINYTYSISGNTINFNDFLITDRENKFKNQEVKVVVYIPKGTLLNYSGFGKDWWALDLQRNDFPEDAKISDFTYKMNANDSVICTNCPEKEVNISNENNKVKINANGIDINLNDNGEKGSIKIDKNGIDINIEDTNDKGKIKIDENGIDIDIKDNRESFKMKIDENGVNVNN